MYGKSEDQWCYYSLEERDGEFTCVCMGLYDKIEQLGFVWLWMKCIRIKEYITDWIFSVFICLGHDKKRNN